MAAGLNFTQFSNWLKEYYINKGMMDKLLYNNGAFFKEVEKRPASQQVGGSAVVVPLKISRNPSASKSFSQAQTNARTKTSIREKFLIPMDDDYAVGRVSNKVIYASSNKTLAFISAFNDEMDDALDSLSKRRSYDIVGSGRGIRGIVKTAVVDATDDNVTVTLETASDIINFDVGMNLVFTEAGSANVTPRTGTLGSASGSAIDLEVQSVNLTDGSFVTKAIATLAATTIVATDEIFIKGDVGENSMVGLAGWIPDSLDTSTESFYGVDRRQNPERLQGFRQSGASGSNGGDIERNIRALCARIYTNTKGSPDAVWLNPLTFDKLVTQMTSSSSGRTITYNVDTPDKVNTATSGFTDIVIRTAGGAVRVYTDPNFPVDNAYCLNMGTWALYYLADSGNRPVDFIKNEAGKLYNVSHDDASIEVRAESYMALACDAPGCNGVVTDIA